MYITDNSDEIIKICYVAQVFPNVDFFYLRYKNYCKTLMTSKINLDADKSL